MQRRVALTLNPRSRRSDVNGDTDREQPLARPPRLLSIVATESRLRVMGGKPRSEHIFSGFPPITDLSRSIAVYNERMNGLSVRSRTTHTAGGHCVGGGHAARDRVFRDPMLGKVGKVKPVPEWRIWVCGSGPVELRSNPDCGIGCAPLQHPEAEAFAVERADRRGQSEDETCRGALTSIEGLPPH